MNIKDQQFLNECCNKSIELLKNNSSKYGILASAPSGRAKRRHYLSIFARDAAICSLGMLASKDNKLIAIAGRSLKTLGKYQTEFGQIPNYVQPERDFKNYWVLGSIDSTLWWLIALYYYNQTARIKYQPAKKIKLAINWLNCQMNITDGLLVQAEASDWADIMPRSGKVLYTNILWLKVNELYRNLNLKFLKRNFENTFYPYEKIDKINRQNNSLEPTLRLIAGAKGKGHYLSFVNYLYWGKDFDIYSHSLGSSFGIMDKDIARTVLSKLGKKQKDQALPIPVLYYPIKENSDLWRPYMKAHNQNYPYQYHNGGIWPFTAAFYAIALFNSGQKQAAAKELIKIVHANKLNDWQFNEWLHGKTGKPMGMHGQSWNAGAYLLAYQVLNKEFEL